MIELVIKIPEKTYKALTHTEFDASLVVDEMRKSIVNGTPLTKGHGRLIDENELKKEAIRCEWSKQVYDMLDHKLSYMKPIINADKENDNEDSN